MKKAHGFLGGAIWLTVSALILKAIGLVYKVPLSYMIGDEGMGYFNSAYTIYTLFYIISTAGIPKSISILTAKAQSEGNGSEAAIFTSAFKTLTAFGLFLTLILVLFSKSFASVIGNEKSTLSILSIAPSVFFVAASGVLRGYLAGKMDFAPIALSELLTGVFKLFLGLYLARVALMRGFSVEVISAFAILGITVGSLFGTLYLGIVYLKKNRNSGTIRAENYKNNLQKILKIAIPLTAASAISSIVGIFDLAIIMNGLSKSGYSDTVSTVLYGNYTTLAVPMLTLVLTLVTPITTASLPTLAKNYSKDNKAFVSTVNKTLSITSFFAIPAFFAFLFLAKKILTVIFEESSATLGAPMLKILSFAVLFIVPLTVTNNAIEATGRVKVPIISLTVGAVVKLLITAVLIKNEFLGILGAPLGTAISYAISLLISFAFLTEKLKKSGKISNLNTTFFSFLYSFLAYIPTILFKKYVYFNCGARLFSLLTLFIFGIVYLFLWLISFIFEIKSSKKMSICTKIKTFSY